LKSNIGPGAAAAIIVVVALVIIGMLWKVYFRPTGSTTNPYQGGMASGPKGGPPTTRPAGAGGSGGSPLGPPGRGAPDGAIGRQ
jgi:hypothetical protein